MGCRKLNRNCVAKKSVSEFSNETSLHGIKHVSNSGWMRRMFWLVLIASCASLLTIQIHKKITDYRDHPIVANINVNYPSELPFPAVVVCNTNQFRISSIPFDVYQVITKVYESGKPNAINFTSDSPNFSLPSVEFMKHSPSSIKDMLLACYWPDGHKCNEADFEQIVTDFGVCYSINSAKINPKRVRNAGVNAGLFMLFNMESYERTGGPLNTQGVKRQIVHKNDGGTCVTEAELNYFDGHVDYSIEKCLADRHISNIVNTCNCLPFFAMPQHNLESPCTVAQHFSCVINVTESTNMDSNCMDNCTTMHYQTQASFSKLPTESLESLMGRERFQKTYQSYLNALERRNRIQTNLVAANKRHLDNLNYIKDTLKKYHFEPVQGRFNGILTHLTMKDNCISVIMEQFNQLHIIISMVDRLLIIDDMKKERAEKTPHHHHMSLNHEDEDKDTAFSRDHFHGPRPPPPPPFLPSELANQQLVPDPLAMKLIYPNLSSEIIISNYDELKLEAKGAIRELDGYVKSMLPVFGSARHLVRIFDPHSYRTEQDGIDAGSAYTMIFQTLPNMYRNGSIGKRRWARETLSIKEEFLEKFFKIVHNLERNLFTIKHEYEALELAQILDLLADSPKLIKELLEMRIDLKDPECVRKTKSVDMDIYHNIMASSHDDIQYFPLLCPSLPHVQSTHFLSDALSCAKTLAPVVQELDVSIKDTHSLLLSDQWLGFIDHLAGYLKSTAWSDSFYQDNILAVNVYYQDLSVEQLIQERSYDIFSLGCDIGGTLGLFLGASILTLFEIVDFFLILPIVRAYKKKFQTAPAHDDLYNDDASSVKNAPNVVS